MKPFRTVRAAGPMIVRVLILGVAAPTVLSCALHRTPANGNPASQATAEALMQVIESQDRVNRYLHAEVVPGLMACWGEVAGEGTVSVRQRYTREGDIWIAGETTLAGSTLPYGSEEGALRCFEKAVRGTSFAAERDDGEWEAFVVDWTLPVPWPKDMREVAARMATNPGGGGGCGGPESPPAACWTCSFIPIIGLPYCAKSCSGNSECEVISNGCKMKPINPKCVTASPFGNIGGLVLY